MPGWHLSFHFHSIQTRLILCKTWSLVTYFLAITATIPHPTAACVTKTIHHRHLQCIKTKAYFIVSLFHFNPKVYWTSTMSKAPPHARSCGKYTYRKVKSLHWVMCSIVGEIKKCPRKSTQFKEIQQVPYIQIFKLRTYKDVNVHLVPKRNQNLRRQSQACAKLQLPPSPAADILSFAVPHLSERQLPLYALCCMALLFFSR